jgi:hypothetical protein
MNIKITDSGSTLLIAGESEEAVRLEVLAREGAGCRLVGAPGRVGSRWFATVTKPGDGRFVADVAGPLKRAECSIERIGLQVILRSPSEDALRDAIANLLTGGAKIVAPPECVRGEWSAVLDAPR